MDNFCQNCGAETESIQEICVKCGVILKQNFNFGFNNFGNSSFDKDGVKMDTGFGYDFSEISGLSKYYQKEFKTIKESNEKYQGKWNWPAMLFGPLWALTKGLWLSAIIHFILSIITGGLFGWITIVIYGYRGNYMYYRLYTEGKQPFIW